MKALITRKAAWHPSLQKTVRCKLFTLLSASPNVVTQVKTVETDGYQAVQLGFETTNKHGKASQGHFKKSNSTPKVVSRSTRF